MNRKIFTLIPVFIIALLMFNFFKSFTQQSSNLSPQAYQELANEKPGVLIDVRTPREYNQGHLSGTDYNLDITSGVFQNYLSQLDKDETYYLYCRTGNRSGQALRIMQKAGFESVYNIGGFSELAQAGLETNRR